jgi:hypothetical protein
MALPENVSLRIDTPKWVYGSQKGPFCNHPFIASSERSAYTPCTFMSMYQPANVGTVRFPPHPAGTLASTVFARDVIEESVVKTGRTP